MAIANDQLNFIRGYNIENAQDWRIYNKGQFEATAKTNNVQQMPIRMHIEQSGTHSNAWERKGAQVRARERRYNS